jgi:hypothetical protein
MTRLIKVAAAAVPRFTEETDQPLDWLHSSSRAPMAAPVC